MTLLIGLFGLFALLVAVPVLLRRPQLAVLGLTFLLTINAPIVLSQRFGVGDVEKLLLGAGLGLALCYRLIYRRGVSDMAASVLVMFGWLAAVLNSLLWSTGAMAGLDPLRGFLPNVLLASLVVMLVDDRTRLLHALAGAAAGCLLLSSVTVAQYALGMGGNDFLGFGNGTYDHIAGEVDALRPSGPIYDPNYYAQMLLPGLALMLGAAIATQRRGARVLLLLGVLVIAAAILLTSSRGALLAVAALLVTLMIRERRASLLLLAVPPVLLTLLLVPSYNERILSMVSAVSAMVRGEEVQDASFAGRLAEMETALILFANKPVSGMGYGTFETKYQQISARNDLKLRSADRAAHSLYLETAAEQGLIGLAAMVTTLTVAFGACLRLCRAAEDASDRQLRGMTGALLAGGVGIFASAVFLHDAYGLTIWLMLALLLSCGRVTALGRPPVLVPLWMPKRA